MVRFRKGELQYYKGLTPKELNQYVHSHPDNTEFVKTFLEKYQYNYVKKSWKKREKRIDL